jgi:hypothetical protein
MTPDLEALVVAAYVFADEYPVPARPGPWSKIADAELVALAVCQAAMGISCDRQFLGLVGYRLPAGFLHPVPVAVPPAPACSHWAVDGRAAAAGAAARRRRRPAYRRHADRGRQLCRQCCAQRVRRRRRLRLLWLPRASGSGEGGSCSAPTGVGCRSATRSCPRTSTSTSRCSTSSTPTRL